MLGLIILFLIYCLIIVNLPLIFELLLFLVDKLWDLLWQLLKLPIRIIGEFCGLIKHCIFAVYNWCWFLLKLSGPATLKYCFWMGRSIRGALTFLYYLADEALHGGEEEEDYYDEEAKDEPDEDQAQEDSYEKALRLLGLQAGCTQESFKRAFKIAMMQAHPDRGGTTDQAVAVGAARDIIKIRNNWR